MPSLRTQEYQFQLQTSLGLWRWVVRMDVSGEIPVTSVKDVVSPYGILRDSIPIPSDVIRAMRDSIVEIYDNFKPSILVGPPNPVIVEIDEGRAYSDFVEVSLTNTGVYGSLLGASLTSSAPYVTVSPANLGSLASNESGVFRVLADATHLLAVDSPYNETVTVQDSNATNSPQVLPVVINVRPKALIETDTQILSFTVEKPLSGSFPAIPVQSFTITNIGPVGSVLDYQTQKLTGLSDNWLYSFDPISGILASGGSDSVEVTVIPASTMLRGTYWETLRVSGYSSNSYVDVLVEFTIT